MGRRTFEECWNYFKEWTKEHTEEIEITWGEKGRPQQGYSELEIFYNLLSQHKPKNILEIGPYFGGTTMFWINAAAPDAKIILIDRDERLKSLLPLWKSWLYDKQELYLLTLDTLADREKAKSEVERLLGGEKLDFLFIDGEHFPPFFQNDFETFAPLVNPGGMIAFHDIAPPPYGSCLKLVKYWKELRRSLVDLLYIRSIEIICRHRTTGVAGIGVLWLDKTVSLNDDILKLLKERWIGIDEQMYKYRDNFGR